MNIISQSNLTCYSDDIVDNFSPTINELERETSAIEEGVFFTRQHELSSVLSRVHVCRRKTMNVTYLLRGKPGVVKSLARHCGGTHSALSHSEIELFFSDIQDHVATMTSKLEHCEQVLSRSHADCLARLSVDKIGTGNRTMKFIIRITVIAAIIVPLNVICGLFGMNVRVPGGDDDRLFWWFGILGLIIFLIFASLIVARRAKVI
jgi:magnesium transporter